jgi:hypothetical protein
MGFGKCILGIMIIFHSVVLLETPCIVLYRHNILPKFASSPISTPTVSECPIVSLVRIFFKSVLERTYRNLSLDFSN